MASLLRLAERFRLRGGGGDGDEWRGRGRGGRGRLEPNGGGFLRRLGEFRGDGVPCGEEPGVVECGGAADAA